MVEHSQSDNPTQQVTHSTGSHDPQIEFQEYKDSSDFLDEQYQDLSAVESTHDDDQHSIDYGTGQNHPRDTVDGTDMNFVSPPTVPKPTIGATQSNDQRQQQQLTQRQSDRTTKTSGQQQKQRSTASILRAADGFNAYFLHLLLVQFNIDINQINDHMLVRAYKQHLTGGSLYTTDFKMLALDDILILNQYVPVGLVTRLIRIWKWAYDKTADNSTEDDWIKVTSEELIEASEKYDADQAYKQLKRKMEMEARIAATLPTPAVAEPAAPTTFQDAVPAAKSSVQQFQQRIKVDKKAYPIFKNEDKYTTWKRGMYNTAQAQGLEKVFNVDTDPTTFTDEEKELFKAQEAIAMDILVATVPVIACQPIIRRHQDNGTAHACLVEIDQYYTTGQMAMRATERAEKKIRDMVLPKDYPHKLAAWFSNWEMTMNDYEEISGETVSEYTKRKWLTSALQQNPNFRFVINISSFNDTPGQPQLPFKDWFKRVVTHANDLDDSFAVSQKRSTNKVDRKDGAKGNDKGHKDKAKSGNSSPGNKKEHSDAAKAVLKKRKVKFSEWKTWSKSKQNEYKAETSRLIKAAEKKSTSPNTTNTNRQTQANATDVATELPVVQVNLATPSGNRSVNSALTGTTTAAGPPRGSAMRAFQSQQQAAIGSGNSVARSVHAPEYQTQIQGETYYLSRSANMARINYTVCQTDMSSGKSLIDRGANGSIAGKDMTPLWISDTQCVDVTGINEHQMKGLPLGTFAAKVWTTEGPVVAIFNQYAQGDLENTIHSTMQLESFNNQVHDKAEGLGGRQLMITPCGLVIPFTVRNGLVHLPMEPVTDDELLTLRKVVLTSDGMWDPTIYDGELSAEAQKREEEEVEANPEDYVAPTILVSNTTRANGKRSSDQWPESSSETSYTMVHQPLEPIQEDEDIVILPPMQKTMRVQDYRIDSNGIAMQNESGNWEYIDDEYDPMAVEDIQVCVTRQTSFSGTSDDLPSVWIDDGSLPDLVARSDDNSSAEGSSLARHVRSAPPTTDDESYDSALDSDDDTIPDLIPRTQRDDSSVPSLASREDSVSSATTAPVPPDEHGVSDYTTDDDYSNSSYIFKPSSEHPKPADSDSDDGSLSRIPAHHIISKDTTTSIGPCLTAVNHDGTKRLVISHAEYGCKQSGKDFQNTFSQRELAIYAATVAAGNSQVYDGLAGRPARTILPSKPDYEMLRRYFAYVPVDRIKDALKNTTLYYRAEVRFPARRHLKSRFPGANVRHLPERAATDTMFSDVPALNDGQPRHGGCTQCQLFVCLDSRYVRVYPMTGKDQVPSMLMQFINECGAPIELCSDGAKEVNSTAIQEICRQMMIRRHRLSEPYNQQQNPAERVIGDIQRSVNVLMDRHGIPAPLWLLTTLHVVDVMGVISQPSLNGMTPYQKVYGEVPDISPYLQFHPFQAVKYSANSTKLHATNERAGRWMGVAHNVGDILTYWILDDETHQLVARSVVSP